jgi:hypothetical protein
LKQLPQAGTFRSASNMSPFSSPLQDMTHSNIFKPQGMFHSDKIRFENTPMEHRLRRLGSEKWKRTIQERMAN